MEVPAKVVEIVADEIRRFQVLTARGSMSDMTILQRLKTQSPVHSLS